MIARNKITIISGKKGEGKTSIIRQIIDRFRIAGITLCGLYSPGLYADTRKIGISVMDIATGRRMQLAYYDPGWDPEMPVREWRFNDEAIAWGDRVLAQCMERASGDVLIIDEIGYLELEKQKGWESVFRLTDKAPFLKIYIVVRENLLVLAQERWQNAHTIAITHIDNIDRWISQEVEIIMELKGRRTGQSPKQQ